MPNALWCLGFALLLDLALREPPNSVHPVAWMGRCIGVFGRWAPRRGRVVPLLAGGLLMLIGVAVSVALGCLLGWGFPMLGPLAWLAEAVVLKCTFSIRGLLGAGRQVQVALEADQLAEARRLVAWHLVSRDTSALDRSQLAAATIESLAENTSDSIVAPLFYYALAGLPGALAYRFVNTCDAMLGYRDPQHQWLGKVPARVDDLANLVPARLTALLMLLAGLLVGSGRWRALRIWYTCRGNTASPNAGHPMSAAAGVLGIELEKLGHYRLGSGQRRPATEDIAGMVYLVGTTVLLAVAALSLALLLYGGQAP